MSILLCAGMCYRENAHTRRMTCSIVWDCCSCVCLVVMKIVATAALIDAGLRGPSATAVLQERDEPAHVAVCPLFHVVVAACHGVAIRTALHRMHGAS